MATPTRTINRIHFEDLENRRFEDLAQLIVHKLRSWIEVNHVGRTGNDDGVDIQAIENDEGVHKRWVIQCKRYKAFALANAKTAIDEAGKDGVPIDVFLLVVGCDVSKATLNGAKKYGAEKGIPDLRIWDASYLEATLVNDRQDLLSIYFGIDIKGNVAKREAIVKSRVAMRERLMRQFKLNAKEFAARRNKRSAWIWNVHNVIIRDVNDDTFPVVDNSKSGISPWFKVQPLDFYHNGIRVVLTGRAALANVDETWELVGAGAPLSRSGSQSFTVYEIGKIPFDNIVDFSKSSDEYGYGPTIYCRFVNGGAPYESIEYASMYGDNEDFITLEPAHQNVS